MRLFNKNNRVGAWRSLVAHLHGVQGVPSSNLGAPTIVYSGNLRWPHEWSHSQETGLRGRRDREFGASSVPRSRRLRELPLKHLPSAGLLVSYLVYRGIELPWPRIRL